MLIEFGAKVDQRFTTHWRGESTSLLEFEIQQNASYKMYCCQIVRSKYLNENEQEFLKFLIQKGAKTEILNEFQQYENVALFQALENIRVMYDDIYHEKIFKFIFAETKDEAKKILSSKIFG